MGTLENGDSIGQMERLKDTAMGQRPALPTVREAAAECGSARVKLACGRLILHYESPHYPCGFGIALEWCVTRLPQSGRNPMCALRCLIPTLVYLASLQSSAADCFDAVSGISAQAAGDVSIAVFNY